MTHGVGGFEGQPIDRRPLEQEAIKKYLVTLQLPTEKESEAMTKEIVEASKDGRIVWEHLLS